MRAALLGVALACACAKGIVLPPAASSPTARWPEGGVSLHAAVREVDITPPLLLGLWGHGPEGRVAMGTLGRLRCRVFFFAERRGDGTVESVALVPCDLPAMSPDLHRGVAEQVQSLLRSAGREDWLGSDRIQVMATHTHAGPAHFFSARSYSGPFGSSLAGYDRWVVNFLSGAIAGAVASAVLDARPARVAWASRELTTLTRNRSMAAFARNDASALPTRLRDRLENPFVRTIASLPSLATDPTLSVLRVDVCREGDCAGPGGRFLPEGVFAVFGMHPTVLPNTNELYCADAFGRAALGAEAILTRDLAARVGASVEDPEAPVDCSSAGQGTASGRCVIVGIANGVEGDVSPDWRNNSIAEMRRIGDVLAEGIVSAFDAAGRRLDDRASLRAVFAEPDAAGAAIPDAAAGVALPAGDGGRRTCARPEMGSPGAGGASDHPTRFRIFPQFREGYRQERPGSIRGEDACHGLRVPLQLTGPFRAGVDFPSTAPVSLTRVGDRVIATVPVEVTTSVGMSIAQTVQEIAGGDVRAVVVGLTNSYLGYVTSGAEYDEQAYEGASNAYGPWSAEFYRNHVGCLARALYGVAGRGRCELTTEAMSVRELTVDPEPTVSLVESVPETPRGEYRGAGGVRRAQASGAEVFEMDFDGDDPRHTFPRPGPLVRVVRVDGGEAVVATDQTDAVELRLLSREGGANRWRVRWYPEFSPESWRWSRTYRFVVGERVFVSDDFSPNALHPRAP